MAENPQQAQTDPVTGNSDATQFDFSKQWYYVRLADKISYEKDGHELDASIYWWHRNLAEKGYFATNRLASASGLVCAPVRRCHVPYAG